MMLKTKWVLYLIKLLIISSKKKKPSPDNASFTPSENSNDSTVDIIFEDVRYVN